MADRHRPRRGITVLLGVRRPAPRLHEHVPVTSVTDQCEHRVADWRYTAAIDDGTGRCIAACGRVVVLAALATPPGPRCLTCITADTSVAKSDDVPQRTETTS